MKDTSGLGFSPAVFGEWKLSDDGLIARFTSSAGLGEARSLVLEVTAAAQDLSGNALVAERRFAFTTASLDELPPSVASTQPLHEALDVAPGADVRFHMTEALDPSSVTDGSVKVPGASGAVTYVAAEQTVVFTPTAPFSLGATVVATLQGVKDTHGNALSTPFTIVFKTSTDAVAPTLSDRSPAASATGIAVNAQVSATFDEALAPATVNASTFTLTANGAPVAGAVSWSASTRTASFAPASPFPNGATVVATLTNGIKDTAGNAFAGATWTFTTQPDTTAPSVVSTAPANGGAAPINASLVVTFNEPMDAATLTLTSVGITGVTGSLTPGAGGTMVTFTPSQPLSPGTTYSWFVTTAVKDVAGNALSTAAAGSFTTSPDTTAPSVLAVSPAAGAANVYPDVIVSVLFSEPMNAASVQTGLSVSSGTATVAGAVAYDASTRTARFTPSQRLAWSTQYTVSLAATVTDTAGNALAPSSFDFTTLRDIEGPAISSISVVDPPSGASPPNSIIVIQFDSSIDPSTATAGVVIRSQDLSQERTPAFVTYDSTTDRLSLDFGYTLPYATTLVAHVLPSLLDPQGNRATQAFVSFVTPADTRPPAVTLTSPVSGASDVAAGLSEIAVFFDEPLEDGPVVGATLNGSPLTNVTVAGTGLRALLNPPKVLPGQSYTFVVPGGKVTDANGNVLATAITVSFSSPPDTTAPSVSFVSVGEGERLVPSNLGAIDVRFDEEMDVATLTAANFTLSGASVTVAPAPDGISAKVSPTAALTPGPHSFTIGAVKDLGGNTPAAPLTVNFRVAGAPVNVPVAAVRADVHPSKLVSNSSGDVLAMWQVDPGGEASDTDRILARVRTAAGTWGAETVLGQCRSLYEAFAASSGTSFLAATSDCEGGTRLWRHSSGTWTESPVPGSPLSSRAVVANGQGYLVATSTGGGVITVRTDVTGTFVESPEQFFTGTTFYGSGGRFFAIRESGTGLLVRVSLDGSSWTAEQQLSSNNGRTVMSHKVATRGGAIVVAWVSRSATTPYDYQLSARRLTATGYPFQAQTELGTFVQAPAYAVAVSATEALVAFTAGTPTLAADIRAAFASTGWTAATVSANAFSATVAAELTSSRAAVAWYAGGGTAASIHSGGAWNAPVQTGVALETIGTIAPVILTDGSDFLIAGHLNSGSRLMTAYSSSAATAFQSGTTVHQDLEWMYPIARSSGFALLSAASSASPVQLRIQSTGTWGAPQSIEQAAPTAGAADLLFARTGSHSVAFWRQRSQYLMSASNGGAWSTPVAATNFSSPYIVAGTDSILIGSQGASYRYSTSTGTFSPVALTPTHVAHDGTQYVGVWVASQVAKFATSVDGLTWSASTDVPGSGAADAWVTAAPSGFVVYVRLSTNQVYAYPRLGGAWLASQFVGGALGRPFLASSASGLSGFVDLATPAGFSFGSGTSWGFIMLSSSAHGLFGGPAELAVSQCSISQCAFRRYDASGFLTQFLTDTSTIADAAYTTEQLVTVGITDKPRAVSQWLSDNQLRGQAEGLDAVGSYGRLRVRAANGRPDLQAIWTRLNPSTGAGELRVVSDL